MQDGDRRAWLSWKAGYANTGPSECRKLRSAHAELATQRIVPEPLVVAHTGVLATTQKGISSGHFACREPLNARPNNELNRPDFPGGSES